jgi:hypothetical protein
VITTGAIAMADHDVRGRRTVMRSTLVVTARMGNGTRPAITRAHAQVPRRMCWHLKISHNAEMITGPDQDRTGDDGQHHQIPASR